MKPCKNLFFVVLAVFFTACALPTEKAIADNHTKPQKNALILQADFAGVVMAGVAYTVSKDLDVFNIRPLIELYNIEQASASMEYNSQTWPAGTVFVSVVDPGVGTPRKSVVLKTKAGLYYVSPDNGSLSGPANAYGIEAVREIDETVNRRANTEWSHTFHGRDVYAYTGARLAAGVITFEEVGPLLEPKVIMLEVSQGKFENGVLHGLVTGGTGRLGNISFNIDRKLFQQINPKFGEMYDVVISNKGQVVWKGSLPYARSFGSVTVGDNLLFMNSSGEVSIAINQGNFANTYNIGSGSDWGITIQKK